jgi:hypothetical protein
MGRDFQLVDSNSRRSAIGVAAAIETIPAEARSQMQTGH